MGKRGIRQRVLDDDNVPIRSCLKSSDEVSDERRGDIRKRVDRAVSPSGDERRGGVVQRLDIGITGGQSSAQETWMLLKCVARNM